MKPQNAIPNSNAMPVLEQILNSNLSEMDKLAQAFLWVTEFFIAHTERQIELHKALKDSDALVKEQIKAETMKFTRGIFKDCFFRITGKRTQFEFGQEESYE